MTMRFYTSDKIYGTSLENKPTGTMDGCVFYESDTLKEYLLVNKTWQLITGNSAGTFYSVNNPSGFITGDLFWNHQGGTVFPRTLTDNISGYVLTSGSTKPRLLGDRFADVINIKDWGAIGDGVADDTLAIQSGINLAQNLTQGAIVLFPPGLYKITSGLRVSGSYVRFMGLHQQGSNSSINKIGAAIYSTTTGIADLLLVQAPGNAGIYEFLVDNLGFHAVGNSEPAPNGIHIKNGSEIKLSNMRFNGGLKSAIKLDAVNIIAVEDVAVSNGASGSIGVEITNFASSLFPTNDTIWLNRLNLFNLSGAAISINGFTDSVYIGNSWFEFVPVGTLIQPLTGTNVEMYGLTLDKVVLFNGTTSPYPSGKFLQCIAPTGAPNYLRTNGISVRECRSYQSTGNFHIEFLNGNNSNSTTAFLRNRIIGGQWFSATGAIVRDDVPTTEGTFAGNIFATSGLKFGQTISYFNGLGKWTRDDNNPSGFLTGDLYWGRNSTNTILNNIGDNVGIGINNPITKLEVSGGTTRLHREGECISYIGDTTVYQAFYGSGVSAGRMAYIGFGSQGTPTISMMNETKFGNLILGTTGVTALFIDTNQRVGINISSPTQSLDVSGQVRIRGGGPVTNAILIGDSAGVGTWQAQNFYPSGSNPSGYLVSGTGDVYWTRTASNSITYLSNLSDNVGIGSTGAIAKIDIRGNAYISGGLTGISITGQQITGAKFFADNFIDFNTTKINPNYLEGRLSYITSEKTLLYNNDIQSTYLPLGQKNVMRVLNMSALTVQTGQAVYITGYASGLPLITLARADKEFTSYVAGLSESTISNGSIGYITAFGMLTGLDTAPYTGFGIQLYLSQLTSGGVTGIQPQYPNYVVPVGTLRSSGSTGTFMVDIMGFIGNTGGYYSINNPSGFLVSGTGDLYWLRNTSGTILANPDNVGINTTVPNQKLHITNGRIVLDTANFSTGKFDSQGITWNASTTLNSFIFNGQAADRPEISWIRGSRTFPEFSIRQHTTSDKGGSIWVGGGTSAPSEKLSVSTNGVGVNLSLANVDFEVSGKGRFNDEGAILQMVGRSQNYIELYPSGITPGRKAYFGYPSSGSQALTVMGEFPFGSLILGTSGLTRLTIDNAGNVGIGDFARARLSLSGNAGMFSLYGTDSSYIQFFPTGLSLRNGYFGYAQSSGAALSIYNEHPTGTILIGTSGVTRLVIDPTGNLTLNNGNLLVANTITGAWLSGTKIVLPNFTIANLPSPPPTGTIVFCSDALDGIESGTIAIFDGNAWETNEGVNVYNTQSGRLSQLNTNQNFQFKDDFFYTSGFGQIGWRYSNTGAGSSVAGATTNTNLNHMGILRLAHGTNPTGFAQIDLTAQFLVSGLSTSMEFITRSDTASTAADRYIYRIGWGDTINGDFTNGMHFEYSDNIKSGFWVCKSSNNGIKSSGITTVSGLSNNWNSFRIDTDTGNAFFYINNTGVAQISTNLPTGTATFIAPVCQVQKAIGTNTRFLEVDRFYLGYVYNQLPY